MINNRMVVCSGRHAVIDMQTNIIMEWINTKKAWGIVPDVYASVYAQLPSVAVNVSFK